jgi:hypothetical protein
MYSKRQSIQMNGTACVLPYVPIQVGTTSFYIAHVIKIDVWHNCITALVRIWYLR